jgi:hypothetical protein
MGERCRGLIAERAAHMLVGSKMLMAGSLVVIAGVVFVVVSAGAGLVVIAPIVLVTAHPPRFTPPFAMVPS